MEVIHKRLGNSVINAAWEETSVLGKCSTQILTGNGLTFLNLFVKIC